MANTYDYSFTFDDEAKTVQASEGSNADVAALLTSPSSARPEIAPPSADTYVRLPGGLVLGGEVIDSAEVQELTGEHEEALAKARGNASRFIRTLLNCGVVSIGDEKASASVLKDLSIGDRETLILGIRRATFGNEVELIGYMCRSCEAVIDINVPLADIPIKRLDEPARDVYEVPLRKGGKAFVRIPNGHDQEFVLESEALTESEQNTLLLSRAVLRIQDSEGHATEVLKRPSKVKGLGIADRRTLLKWCSEIQPGPQYDDVKFVHEECGKEGSVSLSVADLFRDL